ncbi:MAG: diaminopimelate epimerase [Planctomycetaceae bacterium]|nr:diaminopimelate epimerase [Planctomycetaceae bacterium]
MRLPFLKMHGCGNDYVYVDGCHSQLPPDMSQLAVQISDRHRGIGSDGLVVALPPETPAAQIRMQMLNADGSEGGMCGNALRCLAMWMHRENRIPAESRIQTRDRIVEARVLQLEDNTRSAIVSVCLGSGVVDPEDISLPDVTVEDRPVLLRRVDVGNPHAVIFVNHLSSISLHDTGPGIERHSLFPDRTNVEFVQVEASGRLRVNVWERGSGATLACGSGAVASVAAAMVTGRVDENGLVEVHMPGGILQVERDTVNQYWLTGPAVESFHGIWYW